MAIVLPQGRFNNSSDKNIREFIAERCRILAVVGLHGNTFRPHTGTKTSVLFVQKWNDDPKEGALCPRRDDYNIFFATMQKMGKDNFGEKMYHRIIPEDEKGLPEKEKERKFLLDPYLQVKRRVHGAAYYSISQPDLASLLIPILPKPQQQKIVERVKSSFSLKLKSKQLLEIAKTGVERAIETDEETATTWINQQLETLGVNLP